MFSFRATSAGYGPVQVLREVSLRAEAGEIVGIVGRNGVGKTTSLKAMVGLADVQDAEVVIDGQRVSPLTTSAIVERGIGYVAQEREICAGLSVEENLKLGLLATGKDARAIDVAYERFPRLRERSRQRAESLSGGERKLLAFARIMLLEPKVFLVDEPTEGLMPAAVAEIGALIREIRRSGGTVVLVEQNLKLIEELCDRVYLMNSGRIEKTVTALGRDDIERFLGL